MIEVVFTLDYEIYGNGKGSVRDLVLEPTQRLWEVFQESGAPLVVFPDALEFSRMEEAHSDPDTATVPHQLKELRSAGCEIGLHLHPWWANARYDGADWSMDWSERNICALPRERVDAIVSAGISYLRRALDDPQFTPLSFRSGLWAMQPTANVAHVLAQHGVQVDSSVFKGGRVTALGLDYRPALANPASWRFASDVNVPDPAGSLQELPIHTDMVPFWRMLGRRRLSVQRRVPAGNQGAPLPRRWPDFLRFRYPRKLDFCRMTFRQMRQVVQAHLRQRPGSQESMVVAIGHSKDLVETGDIRQFLEFLHRQNVAVTTFSRALLAHPTFSS